jgi:spermidine synthase
VRHPAPRRAGFAPLGLAVAAALAVLPGAGQVQLRMSPYKGLSRTLQLPGTAVEAERSGSLGLLDVVRSYAVPFRRAPGLSLNAPQEPAEQRGIFVDGEGPMPLTRFSGDLAPLAYLDHTTAALAYHLVDGPAVLLLGAGGGSDVLTALVGRAASVDVVELDPGLVRLVREDYRAYAGGLYDRPEVRVHVAEARRFLAASPGRYDLIQLPLLDALGGAGRTGLHETYAYTVEAFLDALDHLTPRGMLSVGRWLSLPPRDVLKALLTAIAALERRGGREPGRHLLVLRSWDTVVLLAKRAPFAASELAAARAFAAGRGFDLDYDPGAPTAEAGRFNTLAGSSLHDDALALLGPGRAAFVAGYKFELRPATDDRPYFFDFVRWRALPELLAVGRRGDAALVDWGHLVQLAGLALAVPLSLLLVLLPLRLGLPRPGGRGGTEAVLFFVLVGAGFMAVEIATIQRLILFLGHPVHAVAASLAAFLGFAGLGGRVAARLDERPAAARGWPAPALAAGLVAVHIRRGPWGHLEEPPPDAVRIRSLDELPAALP